MKIDLRRFRALAEMFAPIVLDLLGEPKLAQLVTTAITDAEQLGGTGDAKRTVAANTVLQGLTVGMSAVDTGALATGPLGALVGQAVDRTVTAINAAHVDGLVDGLPVVDLASNAQGVIGDK